MTWGRHEIWHLVVLGTTLLAAAGVALALLVPLALDESPSGWPRVRAAVAVVAVAAAVLLFWEWRFAH